MHSKLLLTATALIELATGLALLIVPSLVAELLLGAKLDSPQAIMVGRVAGAALLSIGVNCWLAKGFEGSRKELILGLLVYNFSVPVLIAYGALAENMRGIALWPAFGVHAVLAIWCVACIRFGKL
jgi:ABC-type transport system involved in cytochrome c biogenesis permease component